MTLCFCGHHQSAHVPFSPVGALGFYGCVSGLGTSDECKCQFFRRESVTEADINAAHVERIAQLEAELEQAAAESAQLREERDALLATMADQALAEDAAGRTKPMPCDREIL